jgi:hypothetical protein
MAEVGRERGKMGEKRKKVHMFYSYEIFFVLNLK